MDYLTSINHNPVHLVLWNVSWTVTSAKAAFLVSDTSTCFFYYAEFIAQYCACSKLVFSSKQPLSTICFLLSMLLLSHCDCGDGNDPSLQSE